MVKVTLFTFTPKIFAMVHYKNFHLKVVEFSRKNTPNQPNYLFKFKNQNWCRLKCDLSKPTRLKIETQWKKNIPIGITSEEKSPPNHPKIPPFWNMFFSMVFGIFLVLSDFLILFHCIFSSVRSSSVHHHGLVQTQQGHFFKCFKFGAILLRDQLSHQIGFPC